MDHEEVGRFWNANADAWTKLARAGYDVYRDYLNTPAFLDMLPDVEGLSGLDIGCGEGHNTRLLAIRGAHVTAIDIAEVFIAHAKQAEEQEPLGIEYRVASAVELPFANATFDFGNYFRNLDGEIAEWLFGAAPPPVKQGLPKFKTPRFTRTVSQWLNLLIGTGFLLERIEEPRPSDETVLACPDLQDAQVVAYFLHIRVRKPRQVTASLSKHGEQGAAADALERAAELGRVCRACCHARG